MAQLAGSPRPPIWLRPRDNGAVHTGQLPRRPNLDDDQLMMHALRAQVPLILCCHDALDAFEPVGSKIKGAKQVAKSREQSR